MNVGFYETVASCFFFFCIAEMDHKKLISSIRNRWTVGSERDLKWVRSE